MQIYRQKTIIHYSMDKENDTITVLRMKINYTKLLIQYKIVYRA